jgi:hypothetical protein
MSIAVPTISGQQSECSLLYPQYPDSSQNVHCCIHNILTAVRMSIAVSTISGRQSECPLLYPQYPDSRPYSADCSVIINIYALLPITHKIFERVVSFRLLDQTLLLISNKSHSCHMPTHITFLDLKILVTMKLLRSLYIPKQ